MTVDHGADAQPNDDASVVPVGRQRQRKRRCSPAKIERQQRRRWYDGQDLGDTARTPDSGGAQTGGDGRETIGSSATEMKRRTGFLMTCR